MSRYYLRSKTKPLVEDIVTMGVALSGGTPVTQSASFRVCPTKLLPCRRQEQRMTESKPIKEVINEKVQIKIKKEKVEEIKEDIFDLNEFIDETKPIELNEYLDKNKVILEDVDDDGACLYECLSRALVYIYPELVINKKSLMNLCREYIQIHQNKMISLPNGLKIKYKELIELTHDMDIEKYVKRYTRVTSKNWGGLPEIIAVSELFNIEINIYSEDKLGYRKEYTIPIDKNPNIHHSIHLLLDLSEELAHYQLMIV